jgi:hypothetical protein
MEVIIIIRGLILKKVSAGKNPLRGYVVDQRIYKKIRRKDSWEILLSAIIFFIAIIAMPLFAEFLPY